MYLKEGDYTLRREGNFHSLMVRAEESMMYILLLLRKGQKIRLRIFRKKATNLLTGVMN